MYLNSKTSIEQLFLYEQGRRKLQKSGGQESRNALKLTPKTWKLHSISFLHDNFEKSGRPADPSDPPVTLSLYMSYSSDFKLFKKAFLLQCAPYFRKQLLHTYKVSW